MEDKEPSTFTRQERSQARHKTWAMCLVAAARVRSREKKIVFALSAADIAFLQAVS